MRVNVSIPDVRQHTIRVGSPEQWREIYSKTGHYTTFQTVPQHRKARDQKHIWKSLLAHFTLHHKTCLQFSSLSASPRQIRFLVTQRFLLMANNYGIPHIFTGTVHGVLRHRFISPVRGLQTVTIEKYHRFESKATHTHRSWIVFTFIRPRSEHTVRGGRSSTAGFVACHFVQRFTAEESDLWPMRASRSDKLA